MTFMAAITYIPLSDLRELYAHDKINLLELEILTALAILVEERTV